MIVQAILDRHSPMDPVRQGAEYRKTGWNQFDPDAPPYVPDEIEVERIKRVQ